MKKKTGIFLAAAAIAILSCGCGKKDIYSDEKGTVKSLGSYSDISVERASDTVTDEEVDAEIESILADAASFTEVDRPAREGDTLNIDFVGYKDNVAFDGGAAQGYELELGSHTFIDGFEEGLVGAKKGDIVSLNLTFPENYGSTDLAGQDVVFDVTVNTISEKQVPELSDDTVASLGDYKSADDFTAATRERLEEEKREQNDQNAAQDCIDQLVASSTVELDEDAVQTEIQAEKDYYKSMAESNGATLEDLLSMYGQTEDEFDATLEKNARNALTQRLVMLAVEEKEGIEPSEDDLVYAADLYDMDLDTFRQSYTDHCEEIAAGLMVGKFLLENADVTQSAD